MFLLGYLFMTIYLISLIVLSIYCLMQLILLFSYLFNIRVIPVKNYNSNTDNKQIPFITIQLPLYNEKYVINALLKSITNFEYPKDRFEIHILDDSTDETTELAENAVKHFTELGFNINLFHRKNRAGFKAGALRDATPFANGQYIAIFDADFLPYPDFLTKTLESFTNKNIGVVQTRWIHLNQKSSLLTELQALQLNVHFTIEQSGRFLGDHLLQFNGTAGIWRKSCIEDAGGWQPDTLTEDLDLSYRAQLKGWKIVFMEEVTAPAELPSEINGLKSQQFRWMKGGAETALKLLPMIWTSDLKFFKKLMSTGHLLSSSIFIFIFLLGVSSIPLVLFIDTQFRFSAHFSWFLLPTLILIISYFIANVTVAWPKDNLLIRIFKFFILFPIFIAVSMSMALHNSVAVLQGLLGRKSSFVRTPKTGNLGQKQDNNRNEYFTTNFGAIVFIEGILSIFFISAAILGFYNGIFDFVILHILLAFGYFYLFILSAKPHY